MSKPYHNIYKSPFLVIDLRLHFHLSLLKHELLPLDSLPHVKDILDDGLEVTCGIVGFGDEDVVVSTGGCGGVERGDGDESAGARQRAVAVRRIVCSMCAMFRRVAKCQEE